MRIGSVWRLGQDSDQARLRKCSLGYNLNFKCPMAASVLLFQIKHSASQNRGGMGMGDTAGGRKREK